MSSAQAIETSPGGTVVWASAAIAAPLRSLPDPPVTATVPELSEPLVPSPHVIVVEPPSSPQPAAIRRTETANQRIPVMWAGSVHIGGRNSTTNGSVERAP